MSEIGHSDPDVFQHRLLYGLLTLVGVVGILLFLEPPADLHPSSLQLAFIGIGAIYLALGLLPLLSTRLFREVEYRFDRCGAWFGLFPGSIKVLTAGMGLSMLGALSAGAGLHPILPISLPLWILGVSMLLLALRSTQDIPSGKTNDPKTILLIISLLLVAGALRMVQLDQMPFVLSGDEGSVGLVGWEFVDGRRDNLLGLGWFSFPALYSWLLALSQSAFSRTVLAIRLVSALAGVVTVAATFLTGQSLFNRRVGFIAAAWLATFHYHIFFSRIAYNNIFDGLFLILCIGLLERGWVTNQRTTFLQLGIALGFSQFFYTTSHVIPILLLLWIPWLHYSIGSLWERLKNILAGLLVAGFITLPLVLVYATQPDAFFFTSGRVTLLDPDLIGPAAEAYGMTPVGLVLEQTLVTGLGIMVSELQGIYFEPGGPMLFGVSAVIFLVGLLRTALQWRNPRSAILLLTLLASLIIGGLSIQAPSSQRLILLPPVMALIIGATIDVAYRGLSDRLPRFRLLFLSLCLIVITWMAYENVTHLFGEYFPRENYGSVNGEVAQDMGSLLAGESDQTMIYFFGGERMAFDSIPNISYLHPHLSAVSIEDPSPTFFPITIKTRTYFIFLPEETAALDQAAQMYPESDFFARYNRHGRLLYYVRVVDPKS